MMFIVNIIKDINVRIIEIIKQVMKKIIKEVKCYLKDNNSYLKTVFIRVKK